MKIYLTEQQKEFRRKLAEKAKETRVIERAVKLVKTFRDANDIGEVLSQLSEAVDALGYKGNYKEIE